MLTLRHLNKPHWLTPVPGVLFHSLTSFSSSIYFSPCFCNLRQSVKSSFVRSFGVIVSCGGQGYHSSSIINALVDFGRLGLSSWACASSYHPGGLPPALLKQTIPVMRAPQISNSDILTHMFFSLIKRVGWMNSGINHFLSATKNVPKGFSFSVGWKITPAQCWLWKYTFSERGETLFHNLVLHALSMPECWKFLYWCEWFSQEEAKHSNK